jgi:hypothetical protein
MDRTVREFVAREGYRTVEAHFSTNVVGHRLFRFTTVCWRRRTTIVLHNLIDGSGMSKSANVPMVMYHSFADASRELFDEVL